MCHFVYYLLDDGVFGHNGILYFHAKVPTAKRPAAKKVPDEAGGHCLCLRVASAAPAASFLRGQLFPGSAARLAPDYKEWQPIIQQQPKMPP